jgi:DNA-directed RNA polymerase specialized sigma24 family protein
MKLAISDEGDRTTADARPVIRSSDEAELVASTKAGNANGFDELFMQHEALRITRNHEDAEDVVQQSFQKAFVHLHKFEGESSFSTWLTRIAINEALMSLRRSRGLGKYRSTIRPGVKSVHSRWRSPIHVQVPKAATRSENRSEFCPWL